MVSKDSEGKLTCKPIKSRIVSLFAEQNDLQYAVPGGLIGWCIGYFLKLTLFPFGKIEVPLVLLFPNQVHLRLLNKYFLQVLDISLFDH